MQRALAPMHGLFEKINSQLTHQSRRFIFLFSLLLLAIVFWADVATGYEISFSIFYLVPVSIVAWYANFRMGGVIAFVSALLWFVGENITGHVYTRQVYGIWNAVVRFGFFIIVGALMDRLESVMRHERSLSRTDPLTGLLNSRGFFENAYLTLAEMNIKQSPLTLVYFDLDNFKAVNDKFGHDVGDSLLKIVASVFENGMRKADSAARMGGDEFVVLLSGFGFEGAKLFIEKTREELTAKMEKNNWPVTFSIGVLTFEILPKDIKDMIKMTDGLMYKVKKSGKNNVAYYSYRPAIMPSEPMELGRGAPPPEKIGKLGTDE